MPSPPNSDAEARAIAPGRLPAALRKLLPEERDVLQALALGWSPRTRTWLLGFLRQLRWSDANGRAFTSERLRTVVQQTAALGLAVEHPSRPGHWQVAPQVRAQLYLQALERDSPQALRSALGAAEEFSESGRGWSGFRSLEAASAIVRLELHQGRPIEEVERLRRFCHWGPVAWDDALYQAVLDGFDPALFARLHGDLQHEVAYQQVMLLNQLWLPQSLPLVAVGDALLARASPSTSSAVDRLRLRLALAEHALLAGRVDRMASLLADPSVRGTAATHGVPYAAMFEAALAAVRGEFTTAQAGFESTLKALQDASGRRKHLLPPMLAWLYPLSLLAQQTPAHLAQALKFCLAEAGKKTPAADSAFGSMALAIRMRTGDAPRDPHAFAARSTASHVHPPDLWNWLMRAWLADDSERRAPTSAERASAQLLRDRLVACDLQWLAAQLDAALSVLAGRAAPASFFVPAAQESWRMTLAALAALGQGGAEPGAPGADTRLIWRVTLDARGGVTAIEPFEQKRGARGWGKPKAASLTKLLVSERLDPWDARAARAIRKTGYGARGARLDLASAIVALVGHPALELADAPGRFVDLVEASPSIDVLRKGDTLQLRVAPEIRSEDPDREESYRYSMSTAEQKEAEALRLITVVRDSAHRARLIRLTPAQRRAAQLVGKRLVLPRAARDALDAALRGLAAHFQIQADDTGPTGDARAGGDAATGAEPQAPVDLPASRAVAPDARLRAELAPHGDGLTLRLVVVPLGVDGPRVTPGAGRSRLIAAVSGETLTTQRDLDAERTHVQAVLEACPMLDSTTATAATPVAAGSSAGTGCEWVLDNADDALGLLEKLPTLPAVAGLDWPKGKPVSVTTVSPAALRLQVHSAKNWFGLRGGMRLDEQRVVQLAWLLEWSTQGKGRFVPLGEGRYLALTQELRARLDDLATVAELRDGEARFPLQAAPWLQATLEGVEIDADQSFRDRLQRLAQAGRDTPSLPAGLQASLRPYQEEGFIWASRLAQAGFGACLADDMGLGKTLQALAVLLRRAAQGPALVIAPTSLCGNWQAEARRFAPALNVHIYGDDSTDRGERLAQAGPFDVIVASFALVQQAADAFAAPAWHTLIVDEAQAIKNASAKRSQAVFDLQADFRMALSGTPIENRLAELWSIMRFCNPGLLGSIGRFNERFATPIERDRSRDAQRTLRRLIAPFVLRRTKAQVLEDLPPRTELVIDAVPDAHEAAHYEALRRQAVADAERAVETDGPGQVHLHVLAQLTRLRRAACDPRLVSPELALTGAKVRTFAALAAELTANRHKTLVFSQFVDFLALLREPLDAAGIRYQYLDGATPAAERSRRVAAFQAGEGDFFLISLKAGGFGLNLTAADYVVIADPWWNPAAEDQAMGRAHRIGQQRPVTAYRLVTRGTLEEGIIALHHDKRALAEGVLDGGEGASLPSTEELIALIRGSRQRPRR